MSEYNPEDRKQELITTVERLTVELSTLTEEEKKLKAKLEEIEDRKLQIKRTSRMYSSTVVVGELPDAQKELREVNAFITASSWPKAVWIEPPSRRWRPEEYVVPDFRIKKITAKQVYLTTPDSPDTDYIIKRDTGKTRYSWRFDGDPTLDVEKAIRDKKESK